MVGRHPAIGRQGDTIRGGRNMSNNTFREENLEQIFLLDILPHVSFPSLHTYFFSIFEFLNDSSGTGSPRHIVDPTWSVEWRQVVRIAWGREGAATVSVSQIESSRQNSGAALLVAGS